MRIVFLAPLVALLGTVTPISAQSIDESTPESIVKSVFEESDRFKLRNACEPIYLEVGYPNDDAVKMGLTHEALATTVRSRLRAARLYSSEDVVDYSSGALRGRPYLHVNVTTVNRAFGVIFDFSKWLSDPIIGVERFATTWFRGMVGHHGGDAGYVLSAVSRKTDEFIDAYLRVNEPACSRSPIDP